MNTTIAPKTENNGVQAELLKEMSNSSHFLKTKCTNHNGKQKTLFAFIDATNEAGWFDDELANTANLSVGGGAIGRLEEFNANISQLIRQDKSIKEYQTTVYNMKNCEPILMYCKQENC